MHNRLRKAKTVLSQDTLCFRSCDEGVLLEWKHPVAIKKVFCHEHLCVLVDAESVSGWCDVIAGGGAAETKYKTVLLMKDWTATTLSFLKTIGTPNVISLTDDQQKCLQQVLTAYSSVVAEPTATRHVADTEYIGAK